MQVTREFIHQLRIAFINNLEERGAPVTPEIESAFIDAALTVTLSANDQPPTPAFAEPKRSASERAKAAWRKRKRNARTASASTTGSTSNTFVATAENVDGAS